MGESGTFGDAPDNDLSGIIVGVGYVVDRTAGGGTQNFSNLTIEGTPLPENDDWMFDYADRAVFANLWNRPGHAR